MTDSMDIYLRLWLKEQSSETATTHCGELLSRVERLILEEYPTLEPDVVACALICAAATELAAVPDVVYREEALSKLVGLLRESTEAKCFLDYGEHGDDDGDYVGRDDDGGVS